MRTARNLRKSMAYQTGKHPVSCCIPDRTQPARAGSAHWSCRINALPRPVHSSASWVPAKSAGCIHVAGIHAGWLEQPG